MLPIGPMDTATTFLCTTCKQHMPVQIRIKDESRCRPCYNVYRREWSKTRYPLGSFEHRAFCFRGNTRGLKRSSLTAAELRALYQGQSASCKVCAGPLEPRWEIDHIVPVNSGGTHDISNLHLVCYPCNRGKWTLSAADYIAHCKRVAAANP